MDQIMCFPSSCLQVKTQAKTTKCWWGRGGRRKQRRPEMYDNGQGEQRGQHIFRGSRWVNMLISDSYWYWIDVKQMINNCMLYCRLSIVDLQRSSCIQNKRTGCCRVSDSYTFMGLSASVCLIQIVGCRWAGSPRKIQQTLTFPLALRRGGLIQTYSTVWWVNSKCYKT